MNPSVDETLRNLNDCGCCQGRSTETPVRINNRPGLKAIVYRVGTHSQFKQTMLAALSDSDRPGLQALNTRDEDDFSIALLDAWSVVADVLTFYQDRIANESYLRTATERRSVLEMARMIGYQLNPGVAASTYLAFTLETAKGSPSSTKIGIGTKVQSVPGPDEKAQTFEAVEEIVAHGALNQMKPRCSVSQEIGAKTTQLYLKGTDMQLQPGDAILLVGDTRLASPTSERWDFRILDTVTTDEKNDRTLVTWIEALGHQKPTVDPADNPRVYVFRQRAALFGHNAPDWRSMSDEIKENYAGEGWDKKKQWPGFSDSEDYRIYLDAVYPKIIESSWIVLLKPYYVELYKATTVTVDSQTDFTLTSKTNRIDLDATEHLSWFYQNRRDTVVFAQSELLDLADRPLTLPLFGDKVILDKPVKGLEKGRLIIVSGKRLQKVKVADRTRVVKVGKKESTEEEKPLFLVSSDGSRKVSLKTGDVLNVVDIPLLTADGFIKWHLKDIMGFSGFVIAEPDDFEPLQDKDKESPAIQSPLADENDGLVSEVATLEKVEENSEFTTLFLTTTLHNVYLRDTVSINSNVAKATHGETTSEVLGSGDASQPFQSFTLRQWPLTYVSASTPSGAETTLEVRVNDLLWKEVSTFYGHGPDERIYVTRIDDDGKTTVQFGDGCTGARLPTGKENIRASYRKGIGLDGLVKTGQISQAMTRPLGLKGVTNPLPATGAQDSESLSEARRNAPLTVLTLDRIVSLKDYEDFAYAYTGIAKALANWTWDGEKRAVFVTVAGPKGAAVVHGSTLYENLLASMRKSGDPNVPLQVETYQKALFQISGNIKKHPDYESEKVLSAVEKKLREHFSFEARAFGQPVTYSEVVAVIQQVPGVWAVFIEHIYITGTEVGKNTPLRAKVPQAGEEEVSAAELLTLDPCKLGLEVVS
jgi:hypothetical protein